MGRLLLNNFGPINSCDISIDRFTVFTGPQAAGKSTIAKAIAYFRTLKDDLRDCIIKQQTTTVSAKLIKVFSTQMRHKFLQLFGSSRAMDNDMNMQYYYDDNTFIHVSLKMAEGSDYIAPKYIYIDFSKDIDDYLRSPHENTSKAELVNELNTLFHDDYDTIFIPAGRNLITLLTDQMNYLFTMMDEDQKKSIDYCTQKYVERILKIRSSFNSGIEGYIALKGKISTGPAINKCIELAHNILKGRYVFENGEEKLYLDNPKNRYVKINYTSSGQQEIVWLINILLYQLANEIKSFVIIEEPEAHLFPDAQKTITEIVSVFMGEQNAALVTTHSPYILGAVNNMVYANKIAGSKGAVNYESVKSILDKKTWIEKCGAFYVIDGLVSSCLEEDGVLIKNEIIDNASEIINMEYDSLFEIGEAKI